MIAIGLRFRWALSAVFAILVALAVSITAASAAQNVVVEEGPIWNEPRIMDGRVYAIDSFGDSVVVGGTFTSIRNAPSESVDIAQSFLFKFDVSTGQIDTAFAPQIDAEVEGVAISSDGASVYVGGDFVTVNGETRQRLVKLSMVDGSIDPTFVANANNEVKDIALTSDSLIVGGRFRSINGTTRERLAAVDLTTGAVLASFDLPITDSRYEFAEYVQELDASDDENWLVVGGNFQTIDGQSREQIAVIDISGASAAVADWKTDRFVPDCVEVYLDTYIRGIDIAPDSTFFVVNTTGAYGSVGELCDTSTRWELPPTLTGTGLEPTWTNYTGGDTHWAAHITDAAVYVGGHQRWENNAYPTPGGNDDGPGSVERYGIAALDPLTGVPLSWNPGKDRGRGAEAIYSTDDYLFIGSDTVLFNGVVRQRLAVLPSAGGTPNPAPERIELPADLNIAVPGGDLLRVGYDGATFGSSSVVSGPGVDGIDWTGVRDGFVQLGELIYFGEAGAYFERSYDGTSFGTPTNLSTSVGYVDLNYDLTPYDQPYGVDTTDVATYSAGRIFYTRTDDTKLFWRWYSLESGIIGGVQEVAAGGDWSDAVAIDTIGDWMYAAWGDGNLYRMYVRGGVVDFLNKQLVDDGSSGIDWASVTALFSVQGSGSVPPLPPPDPLACDDLASPWLAEYFPNLTLGSIPMSVRCEAVIDNNWASGSPSDLGVDSNSFSARWTRDLTIDADQVLEFTARAADGMRIFVDGALVMDEWRQQAPTTYVALSDTLTAGTHEIVVEYFHGGGRGVAEVAIAILEPPPPPAACDDPGLPWTAEYFASKTVGGNADTVRCEAAIDYDWALGSPAGTGLGVDNFSARWSRDVTFSEPSTLDFQATTDDGIRIFVDGTVVMDEWRDQTATTFTAETGELAAGTHEVVVEYYEGVDDAVAQVSYTVVAVPLPDVTPANGEVDVPVGGQVFVAPDVVLSGTATDDVGVTKVKVAVRNKVDKTWLQADGVTFAVKYVAVPATLDTPGGTLTGWSFPVSLPDGSYTVVLKAFDAAGNVDPTPPWVSFILDTASPDVTPANGEVDVPVGGQVFVVPDVVMSGTATDDVGVKKVRVAIRNKVDKTWLQPDGVTFAIEYASFPATLDTPNGTLTGWSFSVSLPDGSYAVKPKAFDTSGNADPTPPWISFVVDSTSPDVAPANGEVDVPVGGQVFVAPDVVLSGTATDDVGVTKVKVAVRNKVDKTWLQADGVTFAVKYVAVPATLDTPGGTLTGWSFPVSLPDGSYTVVLKAFDAAGNVDPTPPWVSFILDTASPDVTPANGEVDVPVGGQVFVVPDVVMSGTATDDVGVKKVRVAIRNKVDKTWLQPDGVTFAIEYASFPATLDTPNGTLTGWSFSVSLPDGSYAVKPKAFDTSGNADPTPPWISFVVDSTSPDVAPANGEVDVPVGGQVFVVPDVVISGTATDDVGVKKVRVAIRNKVDKKWLQADGVTFALEYASLPATLDTPNGTVTGWTFSVSLPDGSYAVKPKAFDTSGNADPTPPWISFIVDTS